ncbi:Ig-like domain-containing protein [Deinococcus radiopugnans]|uniref:Ig-like domain-containing protein n=1 Tax=Deinococcus radiopugnans TaxID=57497 RepID=UPI0009DE5249|nr:Ig-like domain-containing protein [Deinococcus radiopugnans]
MFNFSSVRRPATIALALTASIAIVACNPAPTPKPAATVTAVTVTATPTTIKVGGTTTVKAVATGTNTPAQTFTFKSSNDAVATVTTAGVVTGKSVGTADITATSTVNTTKSATIKITVEPADTNPGTRPTVKINFAPSGSNVATFDTNSGAAYNPATMTGWVTEATAGTATPAPLDMTKNVRPTGAANVVAGAEPAQLTQINMQCGSPTTGNPCSTGTTTAGAFEYKMADGKYNVTVSVGDGDTRNTNSSHSINVEGTSIISKKTLTAAAPFYKNPTPVEVTVAGGVMTLDAKGGMNTKINYIILEPVN